MGDRALTAEFGNGIAIVGMGCILPGGVDGPAALWRFLCEGKEAIGEVPSDRWNNAAVFDPDPGTPGKTVTKRGGFISDIAEFDAAFFGISPREAAVMDPQQRMLLETAWRALEDAGIQVDKLAGSATGVYIGISQSDYHGIQKFGRPDIDLHTSTGGALSIAANRLSHRFDLRGPSLAIDTACSSSLVALDLACAALRSGKCDMALVGGVNAILTPDVTITFSRASMLSPDGRCKAFDAKANGYVRGEGASVVVIKPLARALADEDRIHAVIRSTAVNQDGRTTTITVPSLPAQVEMLREACRLAAIEPHQVGYVEAHGTGTPVGDPIEATAIGRVFGKSIRSSTTCVIGSIKTNIGHLEPAAGVTGLIKATLCVKHGMVPPHLNFETPNPNIDFNELGIEVSHSLAPFPRRAGRRIAAVNSFGFGGTNACAIVEQPPIRLPKQSVKGKENWPFLLPLSSANRITLEAIAGDIAGAFDEAPSLSDVAGTLALRRSHLDHRAVIVANDREQAADCLRCFAAKSPHDRVISGRRRDNPRLAFVFTGQGAHWWAMGRGLLECDAVFQRAVEECNEEFRALSGISITSELKASQEKSRLDETIVAQPATFALQLGLAARWKAWGVTPTAVIGHSIGEMAASYISGALSLPDAVRVVHHRSRLQEQTRLQGGMAAIGLSAKAVANIIDELQFDLEIAAVNAPELLTIAGGRPELQRFLAELSLSRRDTFTRLLQVDYAFHSRQMDPFEKELRDNLEGVSSRRPDIPMYSTVTGRPIEPDELSGKYWWRNMRCPVLFKDAAEAMIDEGFNTFVELGAHPALTPPLRSCLAHRGREGTVVGSLHRGTADAAAMSMAFAELHVSGVPTDWTQLVPSDWNFVDLPGQRFEKSRYWSESEESRAARFDGPVHPLLGYRLKTFRPTWQSYLSDETPSYLGDHRVDGSVIFPAAGYVELILAAAREVLGDPPWELDDIRFHDALVLVPNNIVLVQTSVDPQRGVIEVLSRIRGRDDEWMLRASARARTWTGPDPKLKLWQPELAPPAHLDGLRFYRKLRHEGHDFGPAFRGVNALWREQRDVLGLIRLPREAGSPAGYNLHPSLLDSCFQIIRGFRDLKDSDDEDAAMALPVSIARLRFCRSPAKSLFSRAVATSDDPSEIKSDLTIIDEAGNIIAAIEGFTCRRVARQTKKTQVQTKAALYSEHWVPLPVSEPMSESPDVLEQWPSADQVSWLLLSDRRGTAAKLAEALQLRGIGCISVLAGQSFQKLDDNTFTSPADFECFSAIAATLARPITRIVHLWSLDQTDGPISSALLQSSQNVGAEALIAITAAFSNQEIRPELTVITAGGAVVDDWWSEAGALVRASIVGVTRTIANEFSDMKPRTIDIDPDIRWSGEVLQSILHSDQETEIAIRGSVRHGSRLDPTTEDEIPRRSKDWNPNTRGPRFKLTMSAPGVLDDLVAREIAMPPVKAGEVLIEVHAVGLNFRDVMAATGLLPPEAEDDPAWQNLGFECAGIVRAVGEGVDAHLVGARVAAVARGSFASHVNANADLVFKIPTDLTFAEAAALPTAYTTAQYALATIGRIRPGERVLIHTATGGVGLAAISIARKHGAKVIATAGSDEKRAYLRNLGIEHVFDSRSLGFADDVLAATDGHGVDLVLNSLPGPFLEKGLSLLASGGRFLEIGKRDIYANTLIGLRTLKRNAAFFAIDLARLAQDQPALLREELGKIIADIVAGELDKLPLVEFPMANAVDAFRHMARARHIGKIVVTCDGSPFPVELNQASEPVIHADVTYLVTGGTAGFGLATAKWLADHGARHLVLVGLTGKVGEQAAAIINAMRGSGVDVLIRRADLSQADDVACLIDELKSGPRPLRGVFHAAGAIVDALIPQLDPARIRRVYGPKVLGAWHLHQATRDLNLEIFVCFSSIAAHLGSIGQAHYAGANAALEAFASVRHRMGLPCLSVAWGAIGDVGYLARNEDVARYLARTGVATLSAQEALDGLERLLSHDCHRIALAAVNWATLARANPVIAFSARTAALAKAHPEDARHGQHLRSRLLGLPEAAQMPVLVQFIREQVAAVLKVPPNTIEMDRPLVELGLDSLTSFELKNRIETELGTTLAIGAFLQKPTGLGLAGTILEKIDASSVDASEELPSGAAATEPTLSIGQEALWYVEQLAPDSPAYGLAMCIGVRPRLDQALIDKSFQYVVARHDSLRTFFPADTSGPIAETATPEEFKLTFVEATAWSEAEFRRELDNEANSTFDLACAPLIRVHLYRRKDRDVILLHVHHIIADATSVAIVVEQLLEAYLALRANQPVRWSRPARPYSTYAAAQRELAKGPAAAAHLEFWRAELANAPMALSLPTDFDRPLSQRGPGRSKTVTMPADAGRLLAALAQSHGVTLFAVLFTAFNALLHRLSGDNDIVVGIPAGGRVRPELEDCVGYLVNPLPVRTRIEDNQSFKDLLNRIDATIRGALEHQEYPFANLVRELEILRDPSRSPIFQVMFAMERSGVVDTHGFAVTLLNTEGASIDIREFKIDVLAVKRDRAQFDLTFILEEFEGQIYGVVDYRTDLWNDSTIDGIITQYQEILLEFIQSLEGRTSDRRAGRATQPLLKGPSLTSYPDVVDAFTATATRYPQRLAVESRGKSYTYGELNARVADLVAGLRARGIDQHSLVGLCIARNADLPATILAVWSVGAAYLPLDPTHPPLRLARIVADAKPALVVVDGTTQETVRSIWSDSVVDLTELPTRRVSEPIQQRPGELAYVIYTSGSTGTPIGVEVRRDGVSNFFAAMAQELQITAEDVLLAVTTISFDIAVLELLLPITIGGHVVIADEELVRDSRNLASRLAKGDITLMQATPATWQGLLDARWRGSRSFTALVGGERLQLGLSNEILSRSGRLWNLYGPTETTIWSTCAQISAGSTQVPIGHPIANTDCLIVDDRMLPVSVGDTGELLIGGRGVARGYVNNPQRTGERFLDISLDGSVARRYFRTGDIVRCSRNGELTFIGRRDQQVKVRGFRIELGEIEVATAASPGVRETAAIVRGTEISDARIVAYVSVEQDTETDERKIRKHLSQILPAYMMPSEIVVVPTFPRLANGKIDRAKLASRQIPGSTRAGRPTEPHSPIEAKLLSLVKEVLDRKDVGIDDDFFAVGGTSLLAMRYLARISDVFNVDLGPMHLMRAPTIAGLATLVENEKRNKSDLTKPSDNLSERLASTLWRPLALASAEGELSAIDAAAIAYLPDDLADIASSHPSLGKMLRPDSSEPYWAGHCQTSMGNIALIVAPVGGRSLFADREMACRQIDAAINYAARLGARTVALTGLIPAATELGLALTKPKGVELTTGHAATAASMTLSTESVMAIAGRNLRIAQACFIGLGAIGSATLRTFLQTIDHPERLMLCDVPAKQSYLASLAEEAKRSHGFQGEIKLVEVLGELPDIAYQASLFIAATNVQGVIDVRKLISGAIVVDDSFPLCFDVDKAIQRFNERSDILFVSGGSVRLAEQIKWTCSLPSGIPILARDSLSQAMLPASDRITGCILSSLLPDAGFGTTLGAATAKQCQEHVEGFRRLDIAAASLHCDSWSPSDSDIEKFQASVRAGLRGNYVASAGA